MARPDPSAEVRVVHRDEHLLVLSKPSGLPTTRVDAGPSLVACARALDPDAPRLHPSSRLDVTVSGLVTFARTALATERLLEARRAQRYRRGYLALTACPQAPAAGTWSAAIGVDPSDRNLRRAVPDDAPGAKPALSRYSTLWARPGCVALWLEPETGRTHQLRVHAALAGSPIYGDRAYGGAARLVLADGTVLTARRTLLHCARVCVPAIDHDAKLTFEAAPPADMVAFAAAVGEVLALP